MRAAIAILFTLAAAVTAAPNVNVLDARQACSYECACSSNTSDPNPKTQTCCASSGGTFDADVGRCTGLTVDGHTTYGSCCGPPGNVCFRSSPSCPP
ncbi:hypothetical protein B0H66DRAFT_598790 [Apodospora peruviana]|uniref:Uncharacterized protein n=1 Tax=Apodospora peruviana TaxID=516989 RepID=A0AAE0IUE1_9PEZI|nr:hypothetical protein B0H66DRAFT_598790 [Apodospora peruviana]